MNTPVTKRDFIKTTGCALGVSLSKPLCSMAQSGELHAGFPIIDLHQHTNYSGRSELQLRTHQKAMGVHRTVLLPAGKYYGLAAKCGGNETVYRMAQLYPDDFVFFANEVPDLPMGRETIEKYLKLGAVGIGEQK